MTPVASLDTSTMDVGMTMFSHYNSMGGVYARDQIQLAPKPHLSPSLPDDALYLIWLKMVFWKHERKMR